MKIKEWLDKLYYQIGNQNYDFQLQILEKDGIKTKRKKYSEVCFDLEDSWNKWFLSKVNQRQIIPLEVVLDLEEKEQLNPIVEELKSFEVKFYVFSTGSRGFHIHIFFNRELSQKEKLKIIKHFEADTQLASDSHMVALEYALHWKSKKIKELIYDGS